MSNFNSTKFYGKEIIKQKWKLISHFHLKFFFFFNTTITTSFSRKEKNLDQKWESDLHF